MTLAWAIVTANFLETECWTGYNFKPYYWIVEGPRLALIAVRESVTTIVKRTNNDMYIHLMLLDIRHVPGETHVTKYTKILIVN